jgi:hypothetical protein
MTQEQFENNRASIVNNIIDLTQEAAQVWMFHPENPNYINPVTYHEMLISKIENLQNQLTYLELDNGVL